MFNVGLALLWSSCVQLCDVILLHCMYICKQGQATVSWQSLSLWAVQLLCYAIPPFMWACEHVYILCELVSMWTQHTVIWACEHVNTALWYSTYCVSLCACEHSTLWQYILWTQHSVIIPFMWACEHACHVNTALCDNNIIRSAHVWACEHVHDRVYEHVNTEPRKLDHIDFVI